MVFWEVSRPPPLFWHWQHYLFFDVELLSQAQVYGGWLPRPCTMDAMASTECVFGGLGDLMFTSLLLWPWEDQEDIFCSP